VNTAVKVVGAVVLVVILIVGLFSVAQSVWSTGVDESGQKTGCEAAILECVQQNPSKSRSWCLDNEVGGECSS